MSAKVCKFGDGKKVVAKGMCATHYQQDRRGGTKAEIRGYGEGCNRVEGAVNDERYVKLKAVADADHDGKMYRLVQKVMSDFADQS
jgi:hypothetical protein